MSTAQVFSLGIGVALRLLINSFCAHNDKLAGALSGIWDGVVAYAAWRTDRLLEPTVLVEIIAAVCFDALYHGSTARLVSLGLGTTLGVLVSDTAGLHTLWDDLGENVQVKLRDLPVDIKDDLDSPDVLSEFSEDVTVIYEQKMSVTSPRTRKMTTAEWIAAQRKARAERSSKSTASRTRHSSASVNISITDLDKSLTSSGFDTQTRVTTRSLRSNPSVTQTQSSRARRDRELLATMTPLPPLSVPSVAKNSEINIDVLSPSISTRISSPTFRPEIVEEISVRESNEGAAIDISKDISRVSSPPKSTAPKSNRSVRKETIYVEETIYPPADRPLSSSSSKTERAVPLEQQTTPHTFSGRSAHTTTKNTHVQTPKSKHTRTASATDRSPFMPFIPPRPVDTREPTIISASHESRKTPGRSPKVLSEDPSLDRVATEILSTWNEDLRARLAQSRASTHRSEHFDEEILQPPTSGRQSQHTTIRSRSSVRLDDGQYDETAQGYVRSDGNHSHSDQQPPAPSTHAPEVVIDYSGDTTRIYIPPPAESGINVRIVPKAEESEAQDDTHDPNDDVHVDHDYLSENYHYNYPALQSVNESAARSQEEMLFIPQYTGSFPELETVPPVDEQGIMASIGEVDDDGHRSHHSQRTHASRASRTSLAEQSSDRHPPSTFELNKAWRDSADPPSSSSDTDYRPLIEPDDPLPVYISENVGVDESVSMRAGAIGEAGVGLGGPSEYLHVARSRAGSNSGSSRHPPVPTSRRSRSAAAASRYSQSYSHHNQSRSHSRRRNEGSNTLDLNTRGATGAADEMTKTPSVEWLGPSIYRSQSVRDRSRRRSVGEASGTHSHNNEAKYDRDRDQKQDRRRSGSIVPIARSHDPRQSSSFVTSPTVDESILSHRSQRSRHSRTPNSASTSAKPTNVNPPSTPNLRSRATDLENKVAEIEARCRALRERIGEAKREGNNKLAFELGCELEDARGRAERLRKRAERVLSAAQVADGESERIDVHRLNALEAVHAVKNALQALQRQARSIPPSPSQSLNSRSRSRKKNKLIVVVDHGQRAAEGSSVRRNYIIDKITRQYHVDVRIDETNPNILHIPIPTTF